MFEPYNRPEEKKQEEGYSIPKILVAALLFALVVAGAFMYFQEKKLEKSVAFLNNERKKARLELDVMIEKYTLAIDDNDFLSKELIDERENLIKMRSDVDNTVIEDFKGVSNFKEKIKDYKETVARVTRESVQSKKEAASNTLETTVVVNTVNDSTIERGSQPIQHVKREVTRVTESPKVNSIQEKETQKVPVETAKKEVVKIAAVADKEKTVKLKKTPTSMTLNRVDMPPTYPGCKGNAKAKKRCFDISIKKFVARKFNTDVTDHLSLSAGRKRMFASFDVNKEGKVVNIRVKGIHKDLEKEAVRVIKKLPKMFAARQDDELVILRNYTFPIYIEVED